MSSKGKGGGRGGIPHPEHPIPFVEWLDEESKFQVNADAAAYLSSLKGPVAVIAVAGKYRTGKSYLLNLLSDQTGAFEVGPTVQACTKGIWLWGKAQQVEGRNMNIVFLDTEGLDSTDRDATFDSRLFALTLLLCSTFVFNAVGSINGEEITKLSLVVNLTKVIHTNRSSGGNDSGQEYASFFPHFIYCIRDFMLELERDGMPLTPNEYMEDALEPEETLEDDGMARNDIRDAVRSFFPKRDCFTLVRPVTDEDKLADLSRVPYDDLREEFRFGIEAMKRRLFTALEVKSVYGRPLNGAMLASLAGEYVTALNESGTPTISTAWERVVAAQCERAVEEGVATYTAGMREALQAGDGAGAGAGASGVGGGAGGGGTAVKDVAALLLLHGTHARAARQTFHSVAVQGDDAMTFEEELEGQIVVALSKFLKDNEIASQAMCEQVLQRLVAGAKDAMAQIGRANTTGGTAAPAGDDSSDVDDVSSGDDSSSLSGIDLDSSSDDEAKQPAVKSRRSKPARTTAKSKPKSVRAEQNKLKGGPAGATMLTPAMEDFWAIIAGIQRKYCDEARGPAAPLVLSEFMTNTVPRFQVDVMERLQEDVDAQVGKLKANATKQSRDLATARGHHKAATLAAENQRAAYEKQLTEVALKASQEKERLRELMESKEQELQRSIAFFEKFQATQTARGKKRDEELEQVRQELQNARAQVESIRDELQEKVEESLAFAAKAAEAHAARADAERRLADTQEAVTGKQSDAAMLLLKLRSAEKEVRGLEDKVALLETTLQTQQRLSESQSEAREAKAGEKAEVEYRLAEAKARLAQAEGDKLQILEEKYAYQSLAAHMKKILAQRNNLKYLQLDTMLRRRFDKLPLPES